MIRGLQSVLVLLVPLPVLCYISTPHSPMVRFVGDDAIFNWTTSDGKKIYSAKFGIAKDNVPDPKFIHINVYTNRVHFNKGMDPSYKNRVDFIGNLTAGRAWFILKNLIINDTNEYIAIIRDDKSGILPYNVKLKVMEKDNFKSTPLATGLLPARFTTTTTLRTKTVWTRPVPPTTTGSQGYRSTFLIIVPTFVVVVTVTMLVCVIGVKRGCSRRTSNRHDVSIVERRLLSVSIRGSSLSCFQNM